jgi:transposase
LAKKVDDSAMMIRAQIIGMLATGYQTAKIADTLDCARPHIYRTTERFDRDGRCGLFDDRRNNGMLIADKAFHKTVKRHVSQTPIDFGYVRPTWTRELLVKVAEQDTGIRVSVTVIGRVLRKLRARRGRPKPAVECTLSKPQKRRRLAEIC